MSIDTCSDPDADSPTTPPAALELMDQDSPTEFDRLSPQQVFGPAAKSGSVYRWGWAVAKSQACDPITDVLARLAVDGKVSSKRRQPIDLSVSAETFMEWLRTTTDLSAADGCSTVIWASALPSLIGELESDDVQMLCESLIRMRESILQRDSASSVSHLMIGAELGLTLTWRCPGLPQRRELKKSSLKALSQWVDQEHDAVSAALENPLETRLVLASLIRCQRLVTQTTKRKWTKAASHLGDQLATWACAMTTHTGSSAFSDANRQAVADDLGKHGLLSAACQFDPECLTGALDAALGKTPSGGRLAWEVSLPEAIHHDEHAKLAVLFPDWDVRRGRTHIDYSAEDIRIEIMSGRTTVIDGRWQTRIETDGGEQTPDGQWSEICQFSDDDIHYLELEQPWTDGLLLQRQWMLIRDDRCLMLADSIIPQPDRRELPESIQYHCRLPMGAGIEFKPEPETREGFLAANGSRALVIPLSAGEWNVGPTRATLKQSHDQCLVHTVSGARRLYAPLWFDFQKRRFKRKRTWRQLTVADQLRLVGRDEAAGFRVQVGSEQWVVYRSLGDRACRSFLGKHLIADFFSSRFDPEDGGHEALVTVDDDQHDQ